MKPSSAWILLLIAGVFEIGWAISMKYSDGFTRFWPSFFAIASMLVSVLLLALCLKVLPVGTAYSVWTGIGAVGTVMLGIWLFNEPHSSLRLLFILLIIAGIVGLRIIK